MKRLICFSLLLLLIGFVGDFAPQTNATPQGHIYLTEIGTFKELYAVDTDSEGRVFIRINNTVWRSVDETTFTKVLDTGVKSAGSAPFLLRVDSNGRIFAGMWDGSAYDVYRSVDHGNSWQVVLENVPRLWRLAEKSDGSLFISTYDTDLDDLIYKSEDGGEHWTVWQNLTGQVTDHIHFVRVNPYNDDIWIGCGDQTGAPLGYHNGTAWTWVYNMSSDKTFTDAIFDENYVYFMPDRSSYAIYRIPHRGSWSEKEEVFNVQSDDTREGAQGYAYSMMAARYEDGLMVVPTDRNTILASWDGEHWLKVAELPLSVTASFRLASISQRKPIYITNFEQDKLYRLDINVIDVKQIFFHTFVSLRGSVVNSQNYKYEVIVNNDTTQYLPFGNVALTNVSASIIGLKSQWISQNSDFEEGDETGWHFWHDPIKTGHLHSITSTESYDGTYSLNITKKWETNTYTYLYHDNTTQLSSTKNDKWRISVYAKANTTATVKRLYLLAFYWDGSGFKDITPTSSYEVGTSWTKYEYEITNLEHNNVTFGFKFRHTFFGTPPDYQLYLDRIFIGKIFDKSVRKPVANGNSIAYKPTEPIVDYNRATSNTENPIITIEGQKVFYSGELTNGTESSATSLSGILTGAVEVSANIQGSGQAIMKITGTRILYEDSIILQGRTSDVYYGRYYGTFSPTITTTDLIAVTNLASNITSLSYTANNLTLTTDSPSGTMSTTKIYTGDKGEPMSVQGATSWSYNSTIKILTITATHSSLVSITVKWKLLGDVNGDGTVNVSDLFRLGETYGATVEDPNWDKEADINRDNIIDVLDLFILGKNYGKIS